MCDCLVEMPHGDYKLETLDNVTDTSTKIYTDLYLFCKDKGMSLIFENVETTNQGTTSAFYPTYKNRKYKLKKGNYPCDVSGTGSAGFARRDCKQENHFAW